MGVLDGKVAVITGSTRGLGRAMAQAYAQAGAAVVISSRNEAAVAQVVADLQAQGWRASGIACDVADREQVAALAAHALAAFGRFDIWVNNAALAGPFGPAVEVAPEMFLNVLRVNIWGTYYGSIEALRHFLPRGEGKLINLLGRGSDGRPAANQSAYAPSKAWARSFTLSLAKEHAQSGVGVYAFQPGVVDTDMMRQPTAIAGHEQRVNALKWVIRLFGNPPQVPAEKALWLASPATDGKTGLEVSLGGRLAILRGVGRELLARLTGRAKPPVELDVTLVPSAQETE